MEIKATDLKPDMLVDILEDAEYLSPETQEKLKWDFARIKEVGGWFERYCPKDHVTVIVKDVDGPIFIPKDETFFLIYTPSEDSL